MYLQTKKYAVNVLFSNDKLLVGGQTITPNTSNSEARGRLKYHDLVEPLISKS
jgi:hypothetical protein